MLYSCKSKSSSSSSSSSVDLFSTSTPSFPSVRSESQASGNFGNTLITMLVGNDHDAKEFHISKNILCHTSSLLRERLSLPEFSSSEKYPKVALRDEDPLVFANLNYWLYTRQVPIDSTVFATHDQVLQRLKLFGLAEFLSIPDLEATLYTDLRWQTYHSHLRPDFPSVETISYVFTHPIRNRQVRNLLVRSFVYEFLRQAWTGPLDQIKAIASCDLEFQETLNQEMFNFSAYRRRHPYFDADLESYEVKGRLGAIMLRRCGRLREEEREVVDEGMPVRTRSRRGARRKSERSVMVKRRSVMSL